MVIVSNIKIVKNMKKYISSIMVLFAMLAFTACSEDHGTTPGSDAKPVVTAYSYDVTAPLNPDNDVNIRFVFNGKTTEAYYLAEKTVDKEARDLTEEAYAAYVVANGKELDLEDDLQSGGYMAELTLTGLFGEYTITAVAVSGSSLTSASTTFTGLDWADVTEGTYYFSNPNTQFLLGSITSRPTTLQVCTTDETLYRFKDVFSTGNHLKINLLPDYTATDADGTYTFFRVKDQNIGVQYGGQDVAVRDIGYWQGDDSFVTDSGYESGMYEDYTCFIMVQLHIGSTNYGYNYYDYFIPGN